MATRSPVKLEITTERVGGAWQSRLLVNDEAVITFDGDSELHAFCATQDHVRAVLSQKL